MARDPAKGFSEDLERVVRRPPRGGRKPVRSLSSHEERTGTIFNIQHFSIQDGPGLRTTLFLKGCPLRCLWCSNPESLTCQTQVKTAPEKCRACGSCIEACAPGALTLSEGRIALDSTLCDRCLRCVKACPHGGVTSIGSIVSADDVLLLLMKDKAFYDHTRGGITFSGGEPLLQHGFLSAMLAYLRGQGVHTALDTTGYAPWPVLRRVLEDVDLLLFDLKHLDASKHKAATGVDNGTIVENLMSCAGLVEIWLRIPLIPGFNDEFSFTDRAVDLAEAVGASRCSFLPFHRWGEYKYSRLGIKNTCSGFPDFMPDRIKAFRMRYRSLADFVFIDQG